MNRSEKLDRLVEEITRLNAMQGPYINASLNQLTEAEMGVCNALLDFYLSQGRTIDYLAASYDVFIKDTVREQIYFKKHKRYRHANYEEVSKSVYYNADYMAKYMYGLAFSTFFWPNHLAIHRFFERTLPRDRRGLYLEVGPGHGLYFTHAMGATAYDRFIGLDLSPTSIEQTKAAVESDAFGHFENYEFQCADFLQSDLGSEKYSCIVIGEVLEHVEDPGKFLERSRDLTTEAPFIFITTAINAGAIDHIYLFDTVASVEQLARDAGLKIKEELVLPYVGKTIEAAEAESLPINIALVLGK